jgi:DNA-binding MarR family transcriptional regulator
LKKSTPQTTIAATPSGGLGEEKLHQIVGYQLAQASIVTYGVFGERVGGPLKLRPVEYTILMLVKENAGVSPAQLSKALEVTRPNISVWIDKLEARGLVKREQNTTDRRGQLLRATDKGAALAAKATSLLLDGERKAFTTLTPVEQMMLTELLHKLACSRGAPG